MMPRLWMLSVLAIALYLLANCGHCSARSLLKEPSASDCKKVYFRDGKVHVRTSCESDADHRSASDIPAAADISGKTSSRPGSAPPPRRSTSPKKSAKVGSVIEMEFPLSKLQCVTSAFGHRIETPGNPHSGVDFYADVRISTQSGIACFTVIQLCYKPISISLNVFLCLEYKDAHSCIQLGLAPPLIFMCREHRDRG
jgi:hypothetical protein